MLSFLNFKYLAIVIVAVLAVAGIGNAAALTVNSTALNVVEGDSNDYVTDTATVTYDIDGSGQVLANVDFTTDAYDDVSFSHDGGTNYIDCSPDTAVPSANWTCTMTNAQANSAASIHIVAAAETDPI